MVKVCDGEIQRFKFVFCVFCDGSSDKVRIVFIIEVWEEVWKLFDVECFKFLQEIVDLKMVKKQVDEVLSNMI